MGRWPVRLAGPEFVGLAAGSAHGDFAGGGVEVELPSLVVG